MKKFFFKLLLNKKQREIIWQALIFSEYTYRRRGRIDDAAVVQTVINETQSTFGVVKETFSREEVDFIVANVIKDTKAEFQNKLNEILKINTELNVSVCDPETKKEEPSVCDPEIPAEVESKEIIN